MLHGYGYEYQYQYLVRVWVQGYDKFLKTKIQDQEDILYKIMKNKVINMGGVTI